MPKLYKISSHFKILGSEPQCSDGGIEYGKSKSVRSLPQWNCLESRLGEPATKTNQLKV